MFRDRRFLRLPVLSSRSCKVVNSEDWCLVLTPGWWWLQRDREVKAQPFSEWEHPLLPWDKYKNHNS